MMYVEQLLVLWGTVALGYLSGQIGTWQQYTVLVVIYVLVNAVVKWFVQSNPNLMASML